MMISATTWPSCCLRRCSWSLARPPPTGWAGTPKPSSAGLFLLSPFRAQSCSSVCPGGLVEVCSDMHTPSLNQGLLGTLMKNSRNSCPQFPDLCAVLYAFQTSSSPELHSLPLLPRRLLCSPWASPLGHDGLEGVSKQRTRVNVLLTLWASFLPRFSALCCLVSNVWK